MTYKKLYRLKKISDYFGKKNGYTPRKYLVPKGPRSVKKYIIALFSKLGFFVSPKLYVFWRFSIREGWSSTSVLLHFTICNVIYLAKLIYNDNDGNKR